MKKQSFVTGAAILMIANAISKILGAVFKIPLTYILNESGMAVYNTSFQIYIMLLSFIISGFPFAVSKLVAEEKSKNNLRRARSVVSVSALLLSLIGAAGSLILYFGAPFFALAMKEEKAVFAIQAVAPSVFFVALGTAYKSYFQGVSNMIPTAVSQVIEAVAKLGAGFLLALCFLNYGEAKTAGGAIMGVTVGEIIATAILIIMYFAGREKLPKSVEKADRSGIISALMTIAIPLLCASVVTDMMNVVDTTMVRSRLLDAGFTADEARFLYGAYSGYALTVFHLPVGILATLGVSILPVIAGAFAVGAVNRASKAAEIAVRITVFLAVPCAVIMFFESSEILNLLFKNTSSAGMLKTVAPCVIMICTAQICAAILQSADKIMLPFFFALIGCVIKLAAGYVLVGDPQYNIYGSAISANIAYFVIMILNLAAVYRNLSLKFDIKAIIIKPASAAAMMCAVIYLLDAPLTAWAGAGFLKLAIICSASLGAYALTLFLTKAISAEEIRKIIK